MAMNIVYIIHPVFPPLRNVISVGLDTFIHDCHVFNPFSASLDQRVRGKGLVSGVSGNFLVEPVVAGLFENFLSELGGESQEGCLGVFVVWKCLCFDVGV